MLPARNRFFRWTHDEPVGGGVCVRSRQIVPWGKTKERGGGFSLRLGDIVKVRSGCYGLSLDGLLCSLV